MENVSGSQHFLSDSHTSVNLFDGPNHKSPSVYKRRLLKARESTHVSHFNNAPAVCFSCMGRIELIIFICLPPCILINSNIHAGSCCSVSMYRDVQLFMCLLKEGKPIAIARIFLQTVEVVIFELGEQVA